MPPADRSPFHPHEERLPSGHARSWYAATAKGFVERPRLDGDRRADVAIIGGGITGCSAALHLAQQGASVVLLDAKRVGWGASGRNGGQLLSGQRLEQSALETLAGRDAAGALWRLGLEAQALVRTLIARHGIDCDLAEGALYAATSPDHFAFLRAEAGHLAADYDYDRITVVPADEMGAYVASPTYHGGLWDAGGGHLHPLNYTLGLARAAQSEGAQFYEQTPVLAIEGDGPVRVRTARGVIDADIAVLAGNGYGLDLVPETSATVLPVHSYVGVSAPLAPDVAASLLPRGGCVSDTRIVLDYYRMTPDGRLLFGGGESYGQDLPDAARMAQVIGKRMTHVFPQLGAVVPEYIWGGRLALTRTRMPVIARPRSGVIVAQGYSGHGLSIATQAGALIAEALAGASPGFSQYAALPAQRFPGGRLLRHPILMLGMLWGTLTDRWG